MKIYQEAKELAQLLNFNRFPVVSIDLDTHDANYHTGCKVRVACETRTHGTMLVGCEMYTEGQRIGASSSGACIKSNYGYSDFMEELELANTPIVKAGDTVVLCYHSKKLNVFFAQKKVVNKHIDMHCVTVATFDDVE